MAACAKAIAEGAFECPEMPHAETLELMRQMDTIRAQFGIVLEASTDLADEGALSQETLNAVNALGGADSVVNAVESSGTKHIEAGNVISAGGVPE